MDATHLEPMSETEASELVGALFPAGSPLTEGRRLQIARESGGSPFVLEQLARYAGALPHRIGSNAHRCRDVRYAARCALAECARIPRDAGHLRTATGAGAICAACGVARERQSLVAMLRAFHLIRSSGSSERVEMYHDRIREVLAARFPSRRRAPDARPHGADTRREAKRRLRGIIRALLWRWKP